MNQIHFLAGLPRSGSTLLGSLLAQNPAIHVTPTSPLFPLLVAASDAIKHLDQQHTFDALAVGGRLYRALPEIVHADVKRPIVFDKHRGWPKHIQAIKDYITPDPKIIAPVRPIAEVITSYLVLADKDPNNFIDAHLKRIGGPVGDNEARADLLWREYLKTPYECLMTGLRTHPECILLVDYNQLAARPFHVLERIYDFCELPDYRHDVAHIDNYCAEDKDAAWGMRDLHVIRSVLHRTSPDPLRYLPQAAIDYFSQFDVQGVLYG